MATVQTSLEPEDIFFRIALGAITTLAATFVAWVQLTPPRLEDLDVAVERGSMLIMDLPRIELPDPVKIVQLPARELDGPPVERRPRSAPTSAPKAERDEPAGSILLQQIGHTGKNNGMTAELFDRDTVRLDEALRGVKNVERADLGPGGMKRAEHDSSDGIIAIGHVEYGSVTTSASAPTIKVALGEREMTTDAADSDASAIRAVLRKNQGRMMTCYEQGAKQDPSLAGRVEVGWTITGGRVTDVVLVGNSSGNAEFGVCMVRAVRSLRFPAGMDAEVDRFPWVFSGR